jgi:hypothetical protein
MAALPAPRHLLTWQHSAIQGPQPRAVQDDLLLLPGLQLAHLLSWQLALLLALVRAPALGRGMQALPAGMLLLLRGGWLGGGPGRWHGWQLSPLLPCASTSCRCGRLHHLYCERLWARHHA